jgi:hypothetical protein
VKQRLKHGSYLNPKGCGGASAGLSFRIGLAHCVQFVPCLCYDTCAAPAQAMAPSQIMVGSHHLGYIHYIAQGVKGQGKAR